LIRVSDERRHKKLKKQAVTPHLRPIIQRCQTLNVLPFCPHNNCSKAACTKNRVQKEKYAILSPPHNL
jgi:hypothetical protein